MLIDSGSLTLRDGSAYPSAFAAGPIARLWVRLRAHALDRALAAGTGADGSPALGVAPGGRVRDRAGPPLPPTGPGVAEATHPPAGAGPADLLGEQPRQEVVECPALRRRQVGDRSLEDGGPGGRDLARGPPAGS